MSEEDFAAAEGRGEFLESAVYGGHRYGTPRGPVADALAAGKHVILEIDVQGARQAKAAMPEALTVFVEPPSWEVLRERLGRRGTEDANALELRLRAAMREVAVSDEFDAMVLNDDLEEATDAVDRLLAGPAPDRYTR